MPDDKDKYLAAGYKWTNMVSKLESYWTPMPVDAPPPPANDGIRIEGGKVFSGDFEITGAVTVRGDEPVASGMVTKNVMTLEDFDKPKDGAFYQIKVLLD